ncbi:translin-associated protein X [Copidosoma floridanum]|uniref:translin-associated protein X n=1 Tax=Copidosoma floridanum TaxID=29053 RepID=UPI0006C97CC0|nr:translin-associated protein X [Copidosoma floridanum]
MSQGRGHYRGKRNNSGSYQRNKKINVGDKGREVLENLDENNPVIKQFQAYAVELDTKHDRFERIIKISRDITIESKRIIFLLHTLDKESKRTAVLGEAETRLNNLVKGLFKKVAQELEDQDPYLYLRAFRAGFQEFVEAMTFYWFLQNKTLYHWTNLEKSMIYTLEDPDKMETDESNDNPKMVQTLVAPVEYVLGIADLTGELMRKCISNLAIGDISSCYQTCNFVRSIYKGFLGSAGMSGREVGRKLYTLKQSLMKMENVCYMIQVRGSEIPKHMLADVAFATSDGMNVEEDEGYQMY